jgi:hypothetical protein
MFKEAMREVLEEDLRTLRNMILGTDALIFAEQGRIVGGLDTPCLSQLKRTVRGLEKQAIKTQAALFNLDLQEPQFVGVGEI